MGTGDSGVFQFFHATGILRAAIASRSGAALRIVAEPRGGRGTWKLVATKRIALLDGDAGARSSRVCDLPDHRGDVATRASECGLWRPAEKAPAMYKLSMGHLFDLTMGAMSVFRVPLILTGVGFLAGTFFNWLFRKRGSPLCGNLAICVMMVILFQAVHMALTVFSPVLGSKPLGMAIKKQYQPGDLIVVNGAYSVASSVNFYTGAQLHMLNGRFNDLWYGSLFPDSPQVFEDDASFAKLWAGPVRVFFVDINAPESKTKSSAGTVLRSGAVGGETGLQQPACAVEKCKNRTARRLRCRAGSPRHVAVFAAEVKQRFAFMNFRFF